MTTTTFDLELTRSGAVHDRDQATALLRGVEDATDLLVLSHGWNNDMAEARSLYSAFLSSLGGLPDGVRDRRLAVLQVFWPSKKFALEHLIPGGGAASAGAENDDALRATLTALAEDPERLGGDEVDPARAANVEHALAELDALDTSEEAQREFVLRVRAVLDPDQAHEDDASQEFFALEPAELFERFGQEVPLELSVGEGGAATLDEGGAAFLGDMLSGARAAARRIANFATYYRMKARAGTVGRTGLATTLLRVRDRRPDLPVHLVGHSFGGRLVTAAASALEPSDAPVSLSLLQAAFSHNGLAEKFDGRTDGAFRAVLRDRRVTGPVVVTHTRNDLAVGVAYPLASRIARDNAAALGDRNDPYGGMGRNGAQHTPEVSRDETTMRSADRGGGDYAFTPGKVYNLNADRLVKDHGDVANRAVAKAVAAAMSTR